MKPFINVILKFRMAFRVPRMHRTASLHARRKDADFDIILRPLLLTKPPEIWGGSDNDPEQWLEGLTQEGQTARIGTLSLVYMETRPRAQQVLWIPPSIFYFVVRGLNTDMKSLSLFFMLFGYLSIFLTPLIKPMIFHFIGQKLQIWKFIPFPPPQH